MSALSHGGAKKRRLQFRRYWAKLGQQHAGTLFEGVSIKELVAGAWNNGWKTGFEAAKLREVWKESLKSSTTTTKE